MIVSALLTMLTGVIFARWMKPEGFGTYSLVLTVATFGASVGAAGMDYTVARYVCFYLGSRDMPLIRTVVAYTMRWGLAGSAVAAIVVFAFLRGGWLNGTKLTGLLPFALVIVLTIPALAAQAILLQALLALQAVRHRVVLEKLIHPLFRLALPFALLAFFHDRSRAAAASILLSSLLLIPLVAVALGKHLRGLPPGAVAPIETRSKWRGYALPYVFFSLQNFVSAGMGVDILLVSALASVNDSGVYAACFRLVLGLTLARAGMDYAFGPKAGELVGKSDFSSIHDLYRTSATIGLAWALPLSVALIAFSRPLMATLYGAPYVKGGAALAWLALGFAIDNAAGCYMTLLAMIGKPWLVFTNGAVSGALTVGLCLILIPAYGMAGAGAAVSLARAASACLGTFEIWRLHRFFPFSRASLKLLFAGISAAILGLVFRHHLPAAQNFLNLGLLVGLVFFTFLATLRITRFSLAAN